MMMGGEIVPLGAFAMVAVISVGVPLARAWGRRMEHGPQKIELTPETNARLERMEAAIDAIAIEVERISEGQRFTTKLLAGRPTPSIGTGGAPDPERRDS